MVKENCVTPNPTDNMTLHEAIDILKNKIIISSVQTASEYIDIQEAISIITNAIEKDGTSKKFWFESGAKAQRDLMFKAYMDIPITPASERFYTISKEIRALENAPLAQLDTKE